MESPANFQKVIQFKAKCTTFVNHFFLGCFISVICGVSALKELDGYLKFTLCKQYLSVMLEIF